MFDDLICERMMPDGFDGRGAGFQTKDLDCELATYTITDAGRLVSDDCHYEETPDHERPYPDAKDWRRAVGCVKRVVDRPNVDRNYHGYLRFYTSDEQNKWHEYTAKFTDGTLVDIVAAAV
jgi:hypothetical protein